MPQSNRGSWKPFVLNSSDAIRSLPPPSQNSTQFAKDLYELKPLQLNRTATVNESIDCWNNGSVDALERDCMQPCSQKQHISTFATPNFPSYTSAHSDLSAAVGGVLSYIFPKQKSELQAKIQEASMSRVYAGIHYRFDCDQGVTVGTEVALHVTHRGEQDGSPH